MRPVLLAVLLITAAPVFSQRSALADSLTREGIALHDAGNYREAVKKFEQVLRLDAGNAFAWYEMGNSCQALQEYKEALKCAEKVIDGKGELLSEAYTLKGNTLDLMGKKEKAIEAYREGISKGKPSHMLHFNLGITLLQQGKYEEAAPEFVHSLKINFSHVSSHYGLGLAYSATPLKVKTLLPLYYFLLLENKGQRAETALKIIRKTAKTQMDNPGGKSHNISIDPATLNDEFGPTEMILALHPAGEHATRQALRDSLHVEVPESSEVQRLTAFNGQFFETLGAGKEQPADRFWQDTYAGFFRDLHANGHTEAFTHYLLLNGGDAAVREWLIANKPRLEAFSNWIIEYQKK